MRRNIGMLGLAVAVLVTCLAPASAQWNADVSQNLLVIGGAGNQDQPKIAPTPGGGCYISWIDFGAAGGYAVRIQHYNPRGEPQFGASGLLLFQTTLSSSQDYALVADAQGNAVLAVQITVSGGTYAGAAMVTPGGALPWGAGVQVSTVDGATMPRVAATSDGYYVVGWSQSGSYYLQKLNSAGVAQWASPVVETPAAGLYTIADMQDGGAGSVIVQVVHQTGTSYTSPKYLKAQKYAGDGSKLWNSGALLPIMDSYSLGMGYFPGFLSDGAGGMVIGWYDGTSGQRRARVQHVTSAGVELFPHNGAVAATTSGKIALSAAVAYDPVTGDFYVGFIQSWASVQNAWGLYAQHFDNSGNRKWGDDALELVPFSAAQCAYTNALWADGAFELFFVPTTASPGTPVQGYRMDDLGNQYWSPVPLNICSYISSKSNKLRAAVTPTGMAILAWGDGRAGNTDVYAQNVNPDGTFGLPVFLRGDGDCDGDVSFGDIDYFVAAIPNNVVAWQALYAERHGGALPPCEFLNNDCTGDGLVNFADIDPFVAAITAPW